MNSEPKNTSNDKPENTNVELCPSCNKNPAAEMHPCPYLEEIYDNHEDVCTCCDDCSYECFMDV